MLLRAISALFLLTLLAVPFLLRPQKDTPHSDEVLVVLSVNPEEVCYEYGRGFSRWMKRVHQRRVNVEWVDLGGTSSTLRFIRSERLSNLQKNSGRGIYDIFFGGGDLAHAKLASSSCVRYRGRGYSCLQPYRPPQQILDDIPKSLNGIKLYDPQGYWYGSALSGFGIACNRRVLNYIGMPLPQSWEELAQPGFFTWVGSGDPRQSGSSHMAYELILQSLGWEQGWRTIMEIGANTRVFSRHGSTVGQDIALGEVACGLSIDYYAYAIQKQVGKAIAFVLPKNKTVLNPDPVSILAGTGQRELAEKFMEYVLSEGQQLRYRPLGHPKGPTKYSTPVMPVSRSIYSEEGPRVVEINPYTFSSPFHYNSAKGSMRWQLLNDLMGAAILENHSRLQRVMERVRAGKIASTIWEQVSHPPFTEAQFEAHARRLEREGAPYRTKLRLHLFKKYHTLYNSLL